MAKSPTTVPEQNAERAIQAAGQGMDWMRQLMEQSLDHTAAMLEGFLANARMTADSFDKQASEARERSMSLAKETLANTMTLAHKVVRAREPQEFLHLQSEFLSHQAQALAEQSKLLGQSVARGANAVGKMTSRGFAEASRRGLRSSEARLSRAGRTYCHASINPIRDVRGGMHASGGASRDGAPPQGPGRDGGGLEEAGARGRAAGAV